MSKAKRIKEDYEIPLIWWNELAEEEKESSAKEPICKNYKTISMEQIITAYNQSKK